MKLSATTDPLPAKAESWQMFDRIAPTYDALNRMLSAGIDRGWRRKVARELPEHPARLRLLDLATGTGDQLFTLLREKPDRWAAATGADLSEGMMLRARAKAGKDPALPVEPTWVVSSADNLPFPDASFEVVSMSFGIRNVPDPVSALREISRVLTPGGRALILEFSLPEWAPLRALYLFYFRHILPRLGGWISGERAAYRYLNTTVEDFPYGEAFARLLENAGLSVLGLRPLTWGIATLYVAEKKEDGDAR
jgi:demethylmenaquinone methyltransferase/2-methoxy-6-polyprenyl-1,4-benzoquinol methylase